LRAGGCGVRQRRISIAQHRSDTWGLDRDAFKDTDAAWARGAGGDTPSPQTQVRRVALKHPPRPPAPSFVPAGWRGGGISAREGGPQRRMTVASVSASPSSRLAFATAEQILSRFSPYCPRGPLGNLPLIPQRILACAAPQRPWLHPQACCVPSIRCYGKHWRCNNAGVLRYRRHPAVLSVTARA